MPPTQSSQSIMTPLDYDLPQPRLLMHKNFKEIPKDWLELEIIRLISYPVMLDTFDLYNTSKEKTCICQFVTEYNNSLDINGLFSKPSFHNNYNKIFEPIKYVGEIGLKDDKSQSSHPIIDSLDYKNALLYSGTKNVIYQQQIIQRQSYPMTEQEDCEEEEVDYHTIGARIRKNLLKPTDEGP